MTNRQEIIRELRAQGKKLREIGEMLNAAHKISRQRVWQLEHGNSNKYAKITVTKETRLWLKSIANDYGITIIDLVNFLILQWLESRPQDEKDEECTCMPNDDILCPACRKLLKSKEVE